MQTSFFQLLLSQLFQISFLTATTFRFWKNKPTNDATTTIIENIIENLNFEIKCNYVLLDFRNYRLRGTAHFETNNLFVYASNQNTFSSNRSNAGRQVN